MDIAIPLYDRFTALDAVGPYEVLSRAARRDGHVRRGREPALHAPRPGCSTIVADARARRPPEPEVVVVPGGLGHRDALEDEALLGLDPRRARDVARGPPRSAPARCCSAPPGVLDGLEATTHWLDLETLERFGARPTERRVVEQGKVITAAGVSSGIDMALTLAARIAGDEVAKAIQLGIEYDPQPPFDCGLDRQGVARDHRARARRGRPGEAAA